MMPLIAVSGKNGQLGWELERLSAGYRNFEFIFLDKAQLDVTNESAVNAFFNKYKPAVFINCAAYTAVDKAEQEQEAAYAANAEAPGLLAKNCQATGSLFISFSTDYVFDGNGSAPYPEDGNTSPINYYGYTKELGEKLALANCDRSIIIRTSWVYSAHGHNFVKTMLRLMKEREEIGVVSDQLGSPTYAKDLAMATMKIVEQQLSGALDKTGIYHFSNQGEISWYDFASKIKELAGLSCRVKAIPTTAFPTPAKRPSYSVLGKNKIVSDYGIQLRDWSGALEECLAEIKAAL